MNKYQVILFFLIIGLFYSCVESEKNAISKSDINKYDANMLKAAALFITPDSLRSPMEKELCLKLEAILYERCIIIDDKLNITISKNEWKKQGIPEIYYDMLKIDVINFNNMLDTTSLPPKQMILDSYRKSKDEYIARKESLNFE